MDGVTEVMAGGVVLDGNDSQSSINGQGSESVTGQHNPGTDSDNKKSVHERTVDRECQSSGWIKLGESWPGQGLTGLGDSKKKS